MSRLPLKEGLLTSIDPDAEPRLLGARCLDCRQLQFPASDTCPYCGGGRCEPASFGARGTLYLFTAVEKAPPGYRGSVPYGFGVVELPEGIRVVSRLTESRPERLLYGMPMRLVLEELFTDDCGNAIV
ncbi:MAG: Zn-ribbon domain-containing OB-fold protein, partial [Candidatus Binatia bacterium]